MKTKIAAILSVLVMATGIVGCNSTKTKEEVKVEGTDVTIKKMAGEELNKIMEDNKAKEKYLVIDVRSKEEYDAGHVKFAINIPVDDIASKLSIIEDLKDKNIVTICNTGKKSQKAAETLIKSGFKNVFNADGVKDYQYKTITKVTNLRAAQFIELVKAGNITIIDSRDKKDFDEGHIKDALSITKEEIDAKMSEIPKDKPVVTYCYTGNKAMDIAMKLSEAGYTAYCSLDGTKEYDKFELVK